MRISRRRVLQTGLAAPLAAPAASAASEPESIYGRLGVRTFINAFGTLTTLSGTLTPPEVRRAMDEASRHYVEIHELQKRAGGRLAELTGAEAAFVTAGASAALCLATCAVTVGGDPARIDRLPDLTGSKNEIVIQKVHRNSYDHAFRMVGVRLIDAETADEVRRAITPRTAALAMVLSHNSLGHKVELAEMIAIAHGTGLPLILDAAAEVPPAENLSKFVKMGADLVAFSGGKQLLGPQCSGLLLGRKDLIEAAYANSAPNNRFARIAKVGKEEIVGLLTAVELFLKRDHAAERRAWEAVLARVAERLRGLPTVTTEMIPNLDYSHSPRLSVQWNESRLGLTLAEMVTKLREGTPAIVAADMTKFRPAWKGLGIFPCQLRPGEDRIVADRVRALLTRKT
jgi:D-glucosaminate-6-phosphate ammonia-lyase